MLLIGRVVLNSHGVYVSSLNTRPIGSSFRNKYRQSRFYETVSPELLTSKNFSGLKVFIRMNVASLREQSENNSHETE